MLSLLTAARGRTRLALLTLLAVAGSVVLIATFAPSGAPAKGKEKAPPGPYETQLIQKLNTRAPQLVAVCKEGPNVCSKESGLPPKTVAKMDVGGTVEEVLDELDKWCAEHPFRCAIVVVILTG